MRKNKQDRLGFENDHSGKNAGAADVQAEERLTQIQAFSYGVPQRGIRETEDFRGGIKVLLAEAASSDSGRLDPDGISGS